MRNYENKTKEDLLEIIEQLEKKIDFLSSHSSSDSSSPSKERFRDKYSTRILDALPDMLTVFDHDANIIELASSPATNHVEGISPNNITTTNVKDILPKEAYESVRKNMDKVILTGESSTARHDLMLDGVLHHYENRIFPLDKEYLLCMCRDISQQWEAEQTNAQQQKELKAARIKAEESDRLKSAFLANMSHEIRTPLNAIVGFSSILADAEEPEEKEEYINIIENNNTLLLQLVGDILDLSKIESGTLEFVYSDIDLNALFQELEESARLRQKNDAVVIRYLPEMPDCFVNIEKNRLTQVVTNMMNNAMKFTPSGSITFGYHLKNTDFLYFYITDTGYGIEKDKKDTVFGRFVKLDSFSQGTGLGLSICQSIVENLGGEIGVESESGKGSTFWFTLPYRPVELKSVREQKEHRLNKVESKLTVLIAEDNESNFLLFESILKRQYNILHAWDGEEAVELFKQYNPHLILMDINMPKKTGYEATQLIREMSPTVPIMAVTAYVYAEDEERILNSGFDAYTSKPINAQKLQSDIVDLLKKQLIFM